MKPTHAVLLMLVGAACGTAPATPDASVVVDAGSNQPPPTFCFGRPRLEFCEDFDGAPLPGSFEALTNTGGTFVIDSRDTTTLPSAALASTTSDHAEVSLHTTLATSQIYKSFVQLRIDQRPASGSVEVLGITLSPGDHYGVELDASDAIWVNARGTRTGETTLIPGGDWQAVRLELTHDGGTRYLSFKLGDQNVIARQPMPIVMPDVTPRFSIGLTRDAGAGWNVRFDTLTFITN